MLLTIRPIACICAVVRTRPDAQWLPGEKASRLNLLSPPRLETTVLLAPLPPALARVVTGVVVSRVGHMTTTSVTALRKGKVGKDEDRPTAAAPPRAAMAAAAAAAAATLVAVGAAAPLPPPSPAAS